MRRPKKEKANGKKLFFQKYCFEATLFGIKIESI